MGGGDDACDEIPFEGNKDTPEHFTYSLGKAENKWVHAREGGSVACANFVL